MTEPFTIRPAVGADLPNLAAIERDAQQRYRSVGYDYCADGPNRDPEEHARAHAEGVVLVAESEGDLVGFLMLWPADGRAHIVEVSVMRAHQGKGIGRALFAAAEDWARAAGFNEATLTTYLDVPWNAPFYRHLGYRDFEPGADRPELLQVQADEAAWGFARWPRGAMRKRLRKDRA
ncbi:MAG: GNAT family N-acetyltransferase [Alphaproteobacteria bacterium]